jgi:hypothetical protein
MAAKQVSELEHELERRFEEYVRERKPVKDVRALIAERYGLEGIRIMLAIAERHLATMQKST